MLYGPNRITSKIETLTAEKLLRKIETKIGNSNLTVTNVLWTKQNQRRIEKLSKYKEEMPKEKNNNCNNYRRMQEKKGRGRKNECPNLGRSESMGIFFVLVYFFLFVLLYGFLHPL